MRRYLRLGCPRFVHMDTSHKPQKNLKRVQNTKRPLATHPHHSRQSSALSANWTAINGRCSLDLQMRHLPRARSSTVHYVRMRRPNRPMANASSKKPQAQIITVVSQLPYNRIPPIPHHQYTPTKQPMHQLLPICSQAFGRRRSQSKS